MSKLPRGCPSAPPPISLTRPGGCRMEGKRHVGRGSAFGMLGITVLAATIAFL
jgi:hypothetical protein